jgi:tetratricopeptide (TPR) repeat protein
MASIIPGYNYDIFISYRQKDNKGDKWVSVFVESLKTELEATFKEDVSIYFDENPHDRLQETYNVSKSLESKLKCLIFIPILSRTYCDPNSYAWQKEFLQFISMADSDQFGREVKLLNENVSSRILPIRIHDLDQDDIKLFEKETKSVIRTLDFVFKTSTGVNRPLLTHEDHPGDNLNKIFYRDQINKTANAIQEIIAGLIAFKPQALKEEAADNKQPLKIEEEKKETARGKNTGLSIPYKVSGIGILAVLLVIVLVTLIPRISKKGIPRIIKEPDGRISIAVNNFDNNTNDTTLNWMRMGIPDLIRNNLAGSMELLVQNSQTINELYASMGMTRNASIIPTQSREAAIKLKAATYITGSFQKYGNNILTLMKLIDTENDELLWTGQAEGYIDDIKNLTDSLSARLRNYLEISVLRKKSTPEYGDMNTSSPQALRKYIEGMQLMMDGKLSMATRSFSESYSLDTTFTLAAFYNAYSYNFLFDGPSAFKWTQIAYKGRNRLPYYYKIWVQLWNAAIVTNNNDSVLYLNNILAQSDIKSRLFWLDVGNTYTGLDQYQKAISAFEKIEELNSNWSEDLSLPNYYITYGNSCHATGNHEKEAQLYKKGIELFPENWSIVRTQAICALSRKDVKQSEELLHRLSELFDKYNFSKDLVERILGLLYNEANSPDEAEKHFRRSVQLMPDSRANKYRLAEFLIRSDRNIREGMALADSLLADSLLAIYNVNEAIKLKGFGYYKQGRYKEALETLQDYNQNKRVTWDPEVSTWIKNIQRALNSPKL